MTVTSQILATALRDLDAAAARAVVHPTDVSLRAYEQVSDYVEGLLGAFVVQEGDILPEYLHGDPRDAAGTGA